MAARLNLPAPGVTRLGGRLPQLEGGAASTAAVALDVAEGDALGIAEGDEGPGVPTERLAEGWATVAVVHPAVATTASKVAMRIFLMRAVLFLW
jgi:hypothetical protein